MDQKAVGDYIKRLRLNAKYTQSELGERLNVTDKAISRWESGMGMPEIGNLLVISKLFGVTVDDILNCNEAAFPAPKAEPENKEPSPSTSESGRQEGETPCAPDAAEKTVSAERACTNSYALSSKFAVILFMSYFSFGMLAASFQPRPVSEFTVPYISVSVFVIFCAVLPLFGKLIPKKIYGIVSASLQAALIVLCVILGGLICVYAGSEIAGDYYFAGDKVAPLSASVALFVLALLFAVRLLYTFADMSDSDKKKKMVNFSALGVSVAALIAALVVSALTTFFERLTGITNICMMTCCAASAVFALKQLLLSKGLDVLNIVLMFGLCVICIALSVTGQFMPTESIVRMDNLYPYFFMCALALASPAALSVSRAFEEKAAYLSARRITSVVAIILLIPLTYYAFDVFAANILLGHSAYAAVNWLKIAVIFAAVVYCVNSCEIGKLLAKSRNKTA